MNQSEIFVAMQLYPNDYVLAWINRYWRIFILIIWIAIYFPVGPNFMRNFMPKTIRTIEILIYFEVVLGAIRHKFISRGLYIDCLSANVLDL